MHLNPAQVKQLAVGIHAQFLQTFAHALHGVFLRDTGDAPSSHEWRSSAQPHWTEVGTRDKRRRYRWRYPCGWRVVGLVEATSSGRGSSADRAHACISRG